MGFEGKLWSLNWKISVGMDAFSKEIFKGFEEILKRNLEWISNFENYKVGISQ